MLKPIGKKLLLLFFFIYSYRLDAQVQQELRQHWEFVKGDLGGVWESVRPITKGGPEEVPLWQQVTLPHCYNAFDAVDPDEHYYQGPAWYRTQIQVNNPYAEGRTLLHFGGVGQKAAVYVYTTKVGEHIGGYDEWTVDITDAVEAFKKTEVFQKQFKGEIPIEVRSDNARDLESIPSDLSDFNLYGGIYRPLELQYVPTLSIEQLKVETQLTDAAETGQIKIHARFLDKEGKVPERMQLTLLDVFNKVVVQQEVRPISLEGDVVLGEMNVKHPKLWSPDSPTLYTVEVSFTADGQSYRKRERIGFRYFEFKEKGPFFLNGKRLLLKGTHRHEDHAGVGAAMTTEMITQEMCMMKEMGVNFIRLGHYQQSRKVLELCDSLGILVWEEVPWCRGGLGGSAYQEQGKRMLTNMIQQHFNHPAIIIWGLGNEIDWPGDFPIFEQAAIRTYLNALNDLAHQLDNSRKTAIRRCDFCKDIPDIYSPSIWAGWYRGLYTDYKASSEEEMNKVKHFFHAEWGGDSHAGRHSESPDKQLAAIQGGRGTDERAGDASLFGGAARVSKDGDWSESYFCNLIDWHLKEQETMPWLTGSAFWIFKDFSTPIRPDNPVPYMNQKGVVARDFQKKESFYVFQSYWSQKLMAHIYGHNWPVRWGDEQEEKMIKVYSNADEAELFVNGQSYGVRKRNSQDFPAAGLRWMVKFKAGTNQLRVVAKRGKETVEDQLAQDYQTQKWSKPARLVLEKVKMEGDTALLQVNLKDAQDISCLDATNWVHFGITGDGHLIDNLGTADGSRKVQAYNGRALIRVKMEGKKAIASVQSPGLENVFLEIEKP